MSHLGTPIKSDASKVGVYCLANDEALEWFQAFVRSFRKFNPTLPLTVIPYNKSIAKLQSLQVPFNFSLMDEVTASRFDAIAHRVAGRNIPGGTFRKLCCFFGPYDTFLFLDSDIVVASDLEPLFQAFAKSATDFVYFDTDLAMVYTPEFAQTMVAEYGSPGFNSGAFLARRDSVTEAEIMRAVASGETIRDHFSIWGEQPFLNYLFDVTRRRLVHAVELVPEITEKPWARQSFHFDEQQECYLDAVGRTMPFIHWPGCEWPTMVRPEVFLRFRTLGMTDAERRRYRREFFYRRFRRKLKERLLAFKLFATLLAIRDKRTRRPASPA